MALALCGWLGAASSRGQSSREYDLKAVLVFNLTRFVEWPPAAFGSADSPLVIGILGTDPFSKVIDEVVRTESHRRHPIEVVRWHSLPAAPHCHILFVGADAREDFASLQADLRHLPVLTVGDYDGFVEGGGMVGLKKTVAGKIQLRINLRATRMSGLVVSGKLLQVADVIHRDD